ncbi:MAG TPA: methyltransferase domain-containing protein [Candidatus Saccharimonadales bacterium]
MNHINPYLRAHQERDVWGGFEAERLKTMDELLTITACKDLQPTLEAIRDTPSYLLDIGAGTGTTIKELCEPSGATYIALDANTAILEARGEHEIKVKARSEDLPLPDGSIDITYSRAVTAWSARPKEVIAEQLRVTKQGGTAIFTEFDWSKAGPGKHSGAEEVELISRMRDTMLGVLQNLGFQPNYGARLGTEIDEVTQEEGIYCERHEQTHEFPEGDHSQLLHGVINNLVEQLRLNPTEPAQHLANGLEADMIRFQALGHHSFNIPVLITQKINVF